MELYYNYLFVVLMTSSLGLLYLIQGTNVKCGLYFKTRKEVEEMIFSAHEAKKRKSMVAWFAIFFLLIGGLLTNGGTITGMAVADNPNFRWDLEITTILIVILMMGTRFVYHEIHHSSVKWHS